MARCRSCQPLIAPLYDGHSAPRGARRVNGHRPDRYDVVHGFWQRQWSRPRGRHVGTLARADGATDGDFEKLLASRGARRLRRGQRPRSRSGDRQRFRRARRGPVRGRPRGHVQPRFRGVPTGASPTTGGCRNCPSPVTKLTWDNAAFVSPRRPSDLGLAQRGRTSTLRVERHDHRRRRCWVHAGPSRRLGDPATRVRAHARRPRGHGRRLQRQPAAHVRRPWLRAGGLEVARDRRAYPLASTQGHFSMEGRALVRTATLGTSTRQRTDVRPGT